MAPTIMDTPQTVSDINNSRVIKERERRSKEASAFRDLRHSLEAADPCAFWRMEKVDIVEGAVYLIDKLTRGCSEQTPDREPIVFEDEKSQDQDEKVDRVQVEKRRRARESRAIKKLKELLMIYLKDAHAKMEKVEVLTTAAGFVKALTTIQKATSIGSDGTSSPWAGSPSSSPGSVPTDSRHSTIYSSSQLLLLASMMQSVPFLPLSLPLAFPTPTLENDNTLSPQSAIEKEQQKAWRPWE